MAKDAVELIKNAEQKAYEIVSKAKADAQKMVEEARAEKNDIIKKSVAEAENEIAKRESDIKKVCDEKIQTEIEAYRKENEKLFSDLEKKIALTAGKIVPEIFM
mgnify:CR=1 FL=1